VTKQRKTRRKMGVPLLYRWLTERYPLINRPASSLPHAEVDNLYIDANGILHNCTHGANKPRADGTPPTEVDMLIAICGYLDSLVQLVRPSRLLYVAIDGVAPRAKMNQQRQRRFRVEREREEAADLEEVEAESKRQKVEALSAAATAAAAAMGGGRPAPTREGEAAFGDSGAAGVAADPSPERPSAAETELTASVSSAAFDSNCITPGTEFMGRCAEVLAYFIRHKVQSDELWRNLRVILSAADAPGEGEHKIAEHIRSSRELPRRHCVYGLDADLIMLALATHAPAICILREKVVFRRASADDKRKVSLAGTGEFVMLHSTLLRRYLDLEFRSLSLSFNYSLDCVLDDLVLISFLVGNDFLPHPPGLQIENNGLDRLFNAYKKLLPGFGGYLVENRQPVAPRLGRLLAEVATAELHFLIENPEASHAPPEAARDEAPDPQRPTEAGHEVDDRDAKEEAAAKDAAEEEAIMALAAAAAAGGAAGDSYTTRRVAHGAATILVRPELGPAITPWKAPGGFSFAKVLTGEGFANRATAAAAAAAAAAAVSDASGRVAPVAAAAAAGLLPKAARDGLGGGGVLGGASSVLKGLLGLGPAAPVPDTPEAQAVLRAVVAAGAAAASMDERLAAAAAELESQKGSALTGAALEAMAEDERCD